MAPSAVGAPPQPGRDPKAELTKTSNFGLLLSNLFKSIRNIIINEKNDQKTKSNKEEAYLSQAIDMIDLERRQKELDRRFIRKF